MLPERFLIFPSQFWAHKDHATLFEALRLLCERSIDVDVVCTGSTRDYRRPAHYRELRRRLHEEGLETRVHVLGLLPRQQQVQLIRRAAAVVQPSLFEGWSALVEDARALGKRLYISDLPVHREQRPADAAFFPVGSAVDLADAVPRTASWQAHDLAGGFRSPRVPSRRPTSTTWSSISIPMPQRRSPPSSVVFSCPAGSHG